MKLFIFIIFYFFSLIFEISFISFLGIAAPISFWVFVLCIYFLNKEDILIFGIISSIFALMFFTLYSLNPLATVLVTVSALLVRTFQGLNKKTSFMAHAVAAIIIYELLRVFVFYSGYFRPGFGKELAINFLFLTALLLAAVFYEIKRGFNKGYSI